VLRAKPGTRDKIAGCRLPFWPVALITAFALTAVPVVKRLRLMRVRQWLSALSIPHYPPRMK